MSLFFLTPGVASFVPEESLAHLPQTILTLGLGRIHGFSG